MADAISHVEKLWKSLSESEKIKISSKLQKLLHKKGG